MSSFLGKLKKGMGVNVEIKEKLEEESPLKLKRKRRVKTITPEPEIKLDLPQELKIDKGNWFEEPAGQLAVDVFQTEQNLIIQTAIAGIKPANLEITIEKDIIAIKGIREKPVGESGDYFTKECYWGPFTREVIAPVEIDPDRVEAAMQEGVLTIKMPKLLREKKRTITVKA